MKITIIIGFIFSLVTIKAVANSDYTNDGYSGPSDEQIKKLTYGKPPEKNKIKEIFKNAIQEKVKDPESIKIRNVKPAKKLWYQILRDMEIVSCWVICGEYDAKNSFGGYSGYSEIPVCYSQGKAWAMTAYSDQKEMLPFSNHPYPCSK